MALWVWAFGTVYVLGFVFVLWIGISMGPVTFGLALLRALVWPWYLVFGTPAGTTLPMD